MSIDVIGFVRKCLLLVEHIFIEKNEMRKICGKYMIDMLRLLR